MATGTTTRKARLIDLSGEAVSPMDHQAGGHKNTGAEEAPYLLRLGENRLLKILQAADKGDRELAFYQTVFPHPDPAERAAEHGHHGRSIPCAPAAGTASSCVCPATLAALQPFVPRFHGVALVDGVEYLALEDLLQSYRSPLPHAPTPLPPSVMDIKIGRKTHGPWATAEKLANELSKFPHQHTIGFRVVGMKVYDPAAGAFVTEGKDFGKKMQPHEVHDALARFFLRPRVLLVKNANGSGGGDEAAAHDRRVGLRRLDHFIKRLDRLAAWFEGQRFMRFYSSSLLFVDANHHDHPGGAEHSHDDDGEGPYPFVDVRMIDFAHVGFRPPRPATAAAAAVCHNHEGGDGTEEAWDEDYLYGLRSLIRHLKELRARYATAEEERE